MQTVSDHSSTWFQGKWNCFHFGISTKIFNIMTKFLNFDILHYNHLSNHGEVPNYVEIYSFQMEGITKDLMAHNL